ncbi:MAG: sel1 repeat family protein, partial [Comamonas sp.]
MKFTPIAALVITSLATIAQSATAQVGAEGRMNFMRDARNSATGPQFENSRLQYGPLPVPGARSTAASGPLQAAERGDAKAQNQLGEMYAHGQGVPQNAAM